MCKPAIPEKQRPRLCTQDPVVKLVEVGPLLVLEHIEILSLLFLFLAQHCRILKEVLV